ncbi:hypothetical protein BJG92_02944 [Arthrobacter sp. SO5]|nr:hypothetical protein [Arthrobacter sp. SO5]
MLVYIRYPDSRPGSLSGIWNMGVATTSSPTGSRCPTGIGSLLLLVAGTAGRTGVTRR